jgi:hypothetical protein
MNTKKEWLEHTSPCQKDMIASLHLYLFLSVKNQLNKEQSVHLLQDIKHILWKVKDIEDLEWFRMYCPSFLIPFLKGTTQSNLLQTTSFFVRDVCLLSLESIPDTIEEQIFQIIIPYLTYVSFPKGIQFRTPRLQFVMDQLPQKDVLEHFLFFVPHPMTVRFLNRLLDTFVLCALHHPKKLQRICIYLLEYHSTMLSPILRLFISCFLQTKIRFEEPHGLMGYVAWSFLHREKLMDYLQHRHNFSSEPSLLLLSALLSICVK